MNGNRMKYSSTPTYGMQKRSPLGKKPLFQPKSVMGPDFARATQQSTAAPAADSFYRAGAAARSAGTAGQSHAGGEHSLCGRAVSAALCGRLSHGRHDPGSHSGGKSVDDGFPRDAPAGQRKSSAAGQHGQPFAEQRVWRSLPGLCAAPDGGRAQCAARSAGADGICAPNAPAAHESHDERGLYAVGRAFSESGDDELRPGESGHDAAKRRAASRFHAGNAPEYPYAGRRSPARQRPAGRPCPEAAQAAGS